MPKRGAAILLCVPGLFCDGARGGVSLEPIVVAGAPAPGVPDAQISRIVGAPAINNSRQLVLRTIVSGVGINELNDFVLYRVTGGQPALIARENDPAVGLPGLRFALDNQFPIPTMNDQGLVAFTNKLRGVGVTTENDTAVWFGTPGELALVLRKNDPVPDYFNPDAVMRNFSQLLLTDAGELGLRADFFIPATGVNLAKTGLGLWAGAPLDVRRMAASGERVLELGPFWDVIAVSGMSLNNSFQASFNMVVLDRQALLISTAFVSGDALSREIVAVTRAQAPEQPEGVRLDEFPGLPVIGSNGDALLHVLLAGPSVTFDDNQSLYRLRDGVFSLLIRSGGQPPGFEPGAELRSVESPLGDVARVTAFRGTVVRPDTTIGQGLFTIHRAESVRLLAATGQPAPEGRFDSIFLNFPFSPAVNRNGQVAFVADLFGDELPAHERVGIWATDASGALRKVIQAGDRVEVAPGDIRTVLDVSFLAQSGGVNGGPKGFNENSELAFTATFTDLTQTAFIATVTADPGPDLNRDGVVDGHDLAILLADWGACGNLCLADFSGDRTTDAIDLIRMLASWTDARR